MWSGRTRLGLTAIAAVALSGCGATSHKSTSGTTAGASAGASSRVVIPALVVRARGQVVAFVKLTVEGRPYSFLVDTGSTRTQVDSTAAQALALPHHGAAISETSLCKVSAQPVTISDWKLGGATLPATTVNSTKIKFAGVKLQGVPFGGTLGADVLSRFGTLTLDFAGQRLILSGKTPSGGKTLSVKVKHVAGEVAVAVRATIHGKPVGYLVDTGAGRTTIDSRAAKQLGLQTVGQSRKTSTAFCSTTLTPVRIDDWAAAGVKLPSTVAISSPSSLTGKSRGKVRIVGLLGLDVMSTFGAVTIDFAGHRLVLGGTVG